jgi:hypothetical protein
LCSTTFCLGGTCECVIFRVGGRSGLDLGEFCLEGWVGMLNVSDRQRKNTRNTEDFARRKLEIMTSG